MRTHWLTLFVLLLFVIAILVIPSSHASTTIGRGRAMRISVASDGTQSDSDIWRSALSSDGRVVAYISDATNLDGAPTPAGVAHLYAFDRATHQTTRLPIAPPGTNVDLATFGHDLGISGDGRFVAFDTYTALVTNDTNGDKDIYLFDRQTDLTTRVSVATDGTQNNEASYEPRLSFDGRYVIFYSDGNILVPGYIGSGVFIHDRQTGVTEAITVATDGSQANRGGHSGAISDDGLLVAFISFSDNLDDDAVPDKANVFLRDRQTGETNWVWGPQGTATIDHMDLSGDGRYLVISTEDNCLFDICDRSIHLYDRLEGEIVNSLNDVTVSNGSYSLLVAEAPVVAVVSTEPLVPEDQDDFWDAYRHDFSTGETTLVSGSEFGPSMFDDFFDHVSISADGRDILFRSNNSFIVAGDSNDAEDIFLWTADADFVYFPLVQ